MIFDYKSEFIGILIISLSLVTINGLDTYAHNFDTDDNSTFLTLINLILVENRLINNSFNK